MLGMFTRPPYLDSARSRGSHGRPRAFFGVSRLNATGRVSNLRSLADFEGVYGQVRSGWAAGDQGRGTLWMQNANGVYLRLVGVRRGLSLTMGADGVRVQFER